LEALDELGLCGQEALEQLAGFLNVRPALVGLLDGSAVLLDFVAHGHQLVARRRRSCRRPTEDASARRDTWHARHSPELPISRKGRGHHQGRNQKSPSDPHGLSSPLGLDDGFAKGSGPYLLGPAVPLIAASMKRMPTWKSKSWFE